jgi:hypothetical protein
VRPTRARPSARSAAIAIVVTLLLPSVAAAVVPDDVGRPARGAVARGQCGGPSRWRLAVGRTERGLRVGLLLRTPAAGQRWNVFIDHDREGFFAGARRTDAAGRAVVRRGAPDHAGPDGFRFGANNTVTGETCRGRVRLGPR